MAVDSQFCLIIKTPPALQPCNFVGLTMNYFKKRFKIDADE